MIINLSRLTCTLRVRSPLVFPIVDAGFKGSAWHGRIDNFIQRDPLLNRALKKTRGSSESDRYLIDAPEDRIDTADGPFSSSPYAVGSGIELSLIAMADISEMQRDLVSRLVAAVRQAGEADGAGFKGTFSVESFGFESYPLRRLAPPTFKPSERNAVLTLEFFTMLRLGGGDHLDAAKTALRQSMQAVPSLVALTEALTRRVTSLKVCDDAAFSAGIEHVNKSLRNTAEIAVHRANVAPFDVNRLSANANVTLPIGGLLGTVAYVGPSEILASIYLLFRMGEWIRVGQKTGLGLGRFRVAITFA